MPPVTVVPAGQSPRRLDVFVATQTRHLSRAVIQRWIDGGVITVNDRRAKPAQKIRPGDVIACHVPVRPPRAVEPEPIAIDVLHEDDALLVVDKPAGLVMHPAPGNWTGTLLNALIHHVRPGISDSTGSRARPGLVHRLDRGTSGVLVVAKTDAAHRALSRQFHAHSVHRVYYALVAGALARGGVIDQPIGRDRRDARRVSTRTMAPRRAVTEYRVHERLGPEATLVAVLPKTGRMHQIRVHLAGIGHPILGDASYGSGGDAALRRPMLHAGVLGFAHPTTGEYQEHAAPLPPDMADAVAARRAACAATSP